MLQHAVQLGLLPLLGRGLQGDDALLQPGGQPEGLLDRGDWLDWGSGRNWERSDSNGPGRFMGLACCCDCDRDRRVLGGPNPGLYIKQ